MVIILTNSKNPDIWRHVLGLSFGIGFDLVRLVSCFMLTAAMMIIILGDNTWGKLVIDKPLVTNEIGKGYLYEAICIPNTLTDEQIHIVFDIIKKILFL